MIDLDLHVAKKIFNLTHNDWNFRFFPHSVEKDFSHLSSMREQHKTFWNNEYKIKIYSKDYGRELFEYISIFKYFGNEYLNKYFLKYHEENNKSFFLYKIVQGEILLDILHKNTDVNNAINLIEKLQSSLTDNMLINIGEYSIIAHDYKMFNVIDVDRKLICFDYDRFSKVNTSIAENLLIEEFWEKLINDDFDSPILNYNKSDLEQIKSYFGR